MPLRMYDPEGDREKASVKDKKKKSKLKGDLEGSTAPYKMLSGGQAKLDKNKNNRIDAQDFKILRREKAKGRGMGLQDEKMKPGRPMKAVLGALALGAAGALGLKKVMGKKKSATVDASKTKLPVGDLVEAKKKQLSGKRMGGPIKKDPTKPVNPFQKRPPKKGGVKSVLKRVGKGVGRFGVPGAIIGAAAVGAKKIADKIKEKKKSRKDTVMDGSKVAASKVTPRMGGGMMQRPMGYKKGSPENPMKEERFQRTRQAAIAKAIGKENVGDPRKVERPSKKNRVAPVKKTYSVGGSVTVKTKLGRNRPTKIY